MGIPKKDAAPQWNNALSTELVFQQLYFSLWMESWHQRLLKGWWIEIYLKFLKYHVVSAIKHVLFIWSYFDSASHVQMPLTSAYLGFLSMLIMDNARIHHGDEIVVLADCFSEY